MQSFVNLNLMKKNHNVYLTNHRKPESEISEYEFYSTHQNSVQTFIDHAFSTCWNGQDFIRKRIVVWEPACGMGNISRTLVKNNFITHSSDLIDRYSKLPDIGKIHEPRDFLKSDLIDRNVNVIMTNPPFKQAEDFIRHSVDLLPAHGWTIMYLKLTYLEGKKRYELFKKLPPKYIFLHSSRQGCSPEGLMDGFNNGGSVAFCWMMWTKGHVGGTEFKWLPPNS